MYYSLECSYSLEFWRRERKRKQTSSIFFLSEQSGFEEEQEEFLVVFQISNFFPFFNFSFSLCTLFAVSFIKEKESKTWQDISAERFR